MDPGGSDLDPSLPEPEHPCLIVEDSQPDSAALEDDPESSYRAILSRRLSNLQPSPHSPVLELISSPAGSRCSQPIDSQFEKAQSNPTLAFEEESQVINLCPLPIKKKCSSEDIGMNSGADSTTHCAQSEEGNSQFGFLELSESQALGGEVGNSQEDDEEVVMSQTDRERHKEQAEQKISVGTSGSQDGKTARSEVSSSSSLEPKVDRELRVQTLLHSQGLQTPGDSDQQDSAILSSQEDMFDADKTGAAVDSTVSEPENQSLPTLTPSHSLRLLHLSGQATLVQESLSQSSVDYVAPTPDNLSHTPLIVSDSPTRAESNHGTDEAMDTSLPPDERAVEMDEEPMETDDTAKPRPLASTPLSQNSPGFVLERTLSLPSQPEFSHDVFVQTPSLETGSSSTAAPHDSKSTPSSSLHHDKPSPTVESASFTLALQLTVNTESSGADQQSAEQAEDSQATQIDGLDDPLCVDASDSAVSRCSQRTQNNVVSSQSRSPAGPKVPATCDSQKCRGDPAGVPDSELSQKSERTAMSLHVQNVNVSNSADGSKAGSSADKVSCSQPTIASVDLTVNSCVQGATANAAPCSLTSKRALSQTSSTQNSEESRGSGTVASPSSRSPSQEAAGTADSKIEALDDVGGEEEVTEEVIEEEEVNTLGPEGSGLGLALSQSQVLSPEPMEVESERVQEGDMSLSVVKDSERSSKSIDAEEPPESRSVSSQPPGSKAPKVSTNCHKFQSQPKDSEVPPLPQSNREGPQAARSKDKHFSDSSGELPFHFTLPKEGELIGPTGGATPPTISQLKQTPRHSTPIETITSFSEKSAAVADISMETSMLGNDVMDGEDEVQKGDGKLSLRMKLVTPVEEGSSERFSLQKPSLSDEEGSVVKVTAVAKAPTSPSVFSRVRQVHRQLEAEEQSQPEGSQYTTTTVRGELLTSPQRSSQASSLGCSSLPNSQAEPSTCPAHEVPTHPLGRDEEPSTCHRHPGRAALQAEPPGPPEPSTPHRTPVKQRVLCQQMSFDSNSASFSSPNKLRQRTISQQTNFDGPGQRSPIGRNEPENPMFRRAGGPAHRRHVRTIQEVRTTITRVITDVYYEDGKEVDRKVTEESEDPVVDCQVLDSDVSPSRTVSSMTSGDLADISSLSSKASSLQHSSGTSSTTTGCFVMPPSRGGKPSSPRRGGGQQQRGQRGQRAGSAMTNSRGFRTPGPRAPVPLTPRGRARRGRPPSRSSRSRGAAAGPGLAAGIHGQPQLSSDDEPFARVRPPPRLTDSPADAGLPSPSDSLRSSPEEASLAGSSFVGLRVVAKWSSNGYFYSGRITKDAGDGRFGLRFDDGYECEVAGKDILLCDPIPMETEVTALLEDEYFSVGIVKGHKTEGQELHYNIEREGQSQWYSRSAIILSVEQGNRLREQHSLGPYEPSTPLAKASDISLDNLVEGKRRRRGGSSGGGGGQGTPRRSSSGSPRTPGPSGKRKLMGPEDERTPAKRGRRGGGCRAAQRVGVCNTSGSGTDLPGPSGDSAATHGPLPQNASLFMGFAFMLTASSEIDRLSNKLVSDDDEEYVQTAPYNRSYTRTQLETGGGFVLLDFNEEQCKAAYQSLLIADQHCRTRKYLLCVASGVPCVSHIWVRDCCKDNKLLNYRNYLLPAGVGLDDEIVEWHPRCSPFSALRVLLVFEEPQELWVQLLNMSGASAVRQYQADTDGSDITPGKFDVVVTNRACPPLVEKSVTSQQLPLVSTEWLIQSLICGERLGFHSKPQYHHDYSS